MRIWIWLTSHLFNLAVTSSSLSFTKKTTLWNFMWMWVESKWQTGKTVDTICTHSKQGLFAILEAFVIISYQCGRETIPPRICSFQHRTVFVFHRKHTEIIQKSVTLKQVKSIENVVFIVLILGKKLIINCNLRKRKEIWSKWFMCGRSKIREKFK